MSKQNQPLFFMVSADWMNKAGRGDEAKTFPVKRIEHDASSPEYDRIVVDVKGEEWPVFRMRGRMVQPYGLLINHGHFEPVQADSDEPPGAHRVICVGFDSYDEARVAANELNTSLKLVVADNTRTAAVETIRKGSTVRRLFRDGTPMSKEFKLGAYIKADDRYALIDAKDRIIYVKPGTLLAIE